MFVWLIYCTYFILDWAMQVHDHELIVSTIVNLVIWFGVSELVTNPLLALILHGIVPSLAVCLLVPLLKREMTPEFLVKW